MKKSKLCKVVVLTTIAVPYPLIVYLIAQQFYNHNFLFNNSPLIFILSFINLLGLLGYFCTEYYVKKDFFFKTNYETKKDIIPKRRNKMLTKEEKQIDKVIHYNFLLSSFILLVIACWANGQYFFYICGSMLSDNYEKQLKMNLFFSLVSLMITPIILLLSIMLTLRENQYFNQHINPSSNTYSLSQVSSPVDDITQEPSFTLKSLPSSDIFSSFSVSSTLKAKSRSADCITQSPPFSTAKLQIPQLLLNRASSTSIPNLTYPFSN